MAELFDNLTRIVGSKLPRRRAFKLVLSALVGGSVAALRPAYAMDVDHPCNTVFDVPGTGSVSVQNCQGLTTAQKEAKKDPACEAAKNAAQNTSAFAACPVECLHKEFVSWKCEQCQCFSSDKFECKGTAKYKCCNVCGSGNKCCASNQVCCGGTTCCAPANCDGNGRCNTGGGPSSSPSRPW
jgi:hypothetical protein